MLTATSVVSRPTAAGKDHILLLSTACGESADEQGIEFAHDDNGVMQGPRPADLRRRVNFG